MVHGGYGGGMEFSFVFISSSVERAPLLSDQYSCVLFETKVVLVSQLPPDLQKVRVVFGGRGFFHFFSRGSDYLDF